MAPHYTWGFVTTLYDFGKYVRTTFGHFLLGSHNLMVTALGLCVKWPLGSFDEFLYMRVLTHGTPNTQRLWVFGVPWSLGFLWGWLQEVVFENCPSDHETWSHLVSCMNPCKPYTHLAFTYSVGPSSIVWSELGPAPPFSTDESAWSVMVTGSQSRLWSGSKALRP